MLHSCGIRVLLSHRNNTTKEIKVMSIKIKMKKRFLASLEAANKVVVITTEESRNLPNMLGQIAPASLNHNGWYAANISGTNTLFVLPEHKDLIKR